jgi:hypothetical protein
LSYARREEKVLGEEKPRSKRKKWGSMNVGSIAWLHAREEYRSKRLRRERSGKKNKDKKTGHNHSIVKDKRKSS